MKQAIYLEDAELSDIKRGRLLEVELFGQVILIGARQSREYKTKVVAARTARAAMAEVRKRQNGSSVNSETPDFAKLQPEAFRKRTEELANKQKSLVKAKMSERRSTKR